MKKTLKGYVLGVLSAAVLASGVAYAANTTTLYNVVANGIKIVIDGRKINPTDANGNTVEPVIVDGTTYLPVRAVANALDKAVSWDGATQTVYLGKNDEIEQPSVWLKDMETFTGNVETKSVDEVDFGGSEYNDILTDNTGYVYKNYWYPFDDKVSYLTNYKYSRFKGTFYLCKKYKSEDYTNRLIVYGDDKLIYTSDGIGSGDKPINFDIDISNVGVLKIVYQHTNTDGGWDNHVSKTFESYGITWNTVYSTPIGNAGLYE